MIKSPNEIKDKSVGILKSKIEKPGTELLLSNVKS